MHDPLLQITAPHRLIWCWGLRLFLLHWIGAALIAIPAISPAAMQFTDVTAAANIHHTHSHSSTAALSKFFNIEHAYSTGGAVAEDFDGDGWMDLYVLQGGDSPNLLYMNQHDGTFADQAAARGAALTGAHVGVCAADFDGDGDIDIFISAATAPHLLLINDGTGHFTVDPQVFALPASGASSPSWGDIDNDGLLDVALGAWNRPGEGDVKIYRNTGSGHLQLYQSLPKAFCYTPHFADLNGDGRQDLLAVADFGQASWYLNGANKLLIPGGTSDVQNGMGCAVGDIDNDGDLDVFISSIRDFDAPEANWGTTGNRLLLNNASGSFTDITSSAGVRDGFWGWGSEFADFDNDGDLDLYEVNGWPESSIPTVPDQFNNKPSRLFENLGTLSFQEISASSGDAGTAGQGRCVVVFDYDNDGRPDIFIANNSVLALNGVTWSINPGPPVLLHNTTPNANSWLDVHLAGSGAPHHPHGIGSRVYLGAGGVQQMRELNASSGFNGHGPGRTAHFGFGTQTKADVVRAVWTNGDKTELRNVNAGQSITLASPRATVTNRMINPGQLITAEIAAGYLPPGATASWSIDGLTYGNPATVTLTTPGPHELVVTISDGGIPAQFLRSETLKVTVSSPEAQQSIARRWNEQNLSAIRVDVPNPPAHARNLFYTSAAMWDAWAAYDAQALGFLHHESATATDIEAARQEAISYAAYRVLSSRYAASVNSSTTLASLNALMAELGFNTANTSTSGNTPAALGNRVAQTVLAYASTDGSANASVFLGGSYTAVNNPLPVAGSGSVMNDPNKWQPLLFVVALTQNGQPTNLIQSFVGSHWGGVRPFALSSLDGGYLHIDPGTPAQLGGASDLRFKQGVTDVISFSSQLDATNGSLLDISPGARGNNQLGLNNGTGRPLNPVTLVPYAPNVVKHGDFSRVLAEYWADGPSSETPPGHWNVLANTVADTPGFSRKIGGIGPVLSPLEWDVKIYLALNAAVHDAAIVAWGCKRIYDTVRPVSSIRCMGGLGQSSDPGGTSYHPQGLPLVPGLVEVVTAASSASGQRHEQLSAHIGKVAIHTWSAGVSPSPGGVKWIRAVDWLPYQRTTFVTPAFPGYVSGHSTFSRAAAEVMVKMTGSEFFPGGIGTFTAPQNTFLKFETGPTTDVVLQWATYYDAADLAGISRIYGGIHFPGDDGPGRFIGSKCGIAAWNLAKKYFDGSIASEPFAAQLKPAGAGALRLDWNSTRGAYYHVQQSDDLSANSFTDLGGWIWSGETLETVQLPAPPPASPRKFYRVIRSNGTP